MTDLIPTQGAPLAAYRDDVLAFAAASSAANTRRAYRAAWESFCVWCEAHAVTALPASPENCLVCWTIST